MSRKPVDKPNPLVPGPALICKVGSIVVHVEEGTSRDAHSYDWLAISQLIADPEVQAWLNGLRKLAMVPVKRNER